MIPNDPVILLGFINMKLRDFYKDLDALCEDLDLDRKELEDRLAGIGCRYEEESNRFL